VVYARVASGGITKRINIVIGGAESVLLNDPLGVLVVHENVIGSYNDGGSPRALPFGPGGCGYFNCITKDTCREACVGYEYFSIQYHFYDCWCGNDYASVIRYGPGSCGEDGASHCNYVYQTIIPSYPAFTGLSYGPYIKGSNNGAANIQRISASAYVDRMHSDSVRFPITSYGVYRKSGNSYSTFPSNIYLESGSSGDLMIRTDTSVAETIYIKASTVSGNYNYLPIDVIVCGGETITLAQPNHDIF